jgi:hypothetical protein
MAEKFFLQLVLFFLAVKYGVIASGFEKWSSDENYFYLDSKVFKKQAVSHKNGATFLC